MLLKCLAYLPKEFAPWPEAETSGAKLEETGFSPQPTLTGSGSASRDAPARRPSLDVKKALRFEVEWARAGRPLSVAEMRKVR
jgi:hypothetical protein